MEGLSGVRLARGSFPCNGRSLAARQHLVLLRQPSSSFQCWRLALTPVTLSLKTSLPDGVATENGVSPLAKEEVSTNLAGEDVADEDVALEEGPKVTVKFVLEKKCYYGQRYNIVGEDPLFGSWDVRAGIPMQWADGDMWTVDVEVPAGKQFEFKFVMTGESGEVVWQPGANRVFDTEGVPPLVVSEAWDYVEEVGNELSELVQDITGSNSDTVEAFAPSEDTARDEVVKALESTGYPEVDKQPVSESDEEAAPEILVAELDIAATAVKTAAVVDDAA